MGTHPSPPSLAGRKVFVPRMTYGGARAFAAALRSVGIDAEITPPSDARTLEYGARYLTGDECFPAKVTLGDLLKIIEKTDLTRQKLAFFMPTANGPCRFGQYATLFTKILKDLDLEGDVIVFSPDSQIGYVNLGESASELKRSTWRALVSADILRKLLLKTRPYETQPGTSDRIYEECLGDLCHVLETPRLSHGERLKLLTESLGRSRDRFRAVPATYDRNRPLVGIVGEIFCRLNTFSNENVARVVEAHGGEVWLSDIAEWIWYTNAERERRLKLEGKAWSLSMAGEKIKGYVQRHDEHALFATCSEDFRGYEEPASVIDMLEASSRYLPRSGAIGEMVVSIGKTVYLYRKGIDGILDISPFTCMNGITTEAIYPRISRDCDALPIRNFYFDGTQTDLDRDVGIFMELARSYQKRKKVPRCFPSCFPVPGADVTPELPRRLQGSLQTG